MKGRNRNPIRPWSDLPPELLSAIANPLTSNPISIISFRSICRSWRSSCPRLSNSSILSPILPLPIPLPRRRDSYEPYSYISLTIIYAVDRPLQSPGIEFSSLSPDAWIVFVDEFIPGKLSIRKPFSTSSYSTPINFPNFNLLNYNVHELGRFHTISHSTYSAGRPNFVRRKPIFNLTTTVDKVVMFPNALAAITLHYNGTLRMYRLNVEINEGISTCERKYDGRRFRFDDIIEFKGRVLGIDRRCRVYQIHYHSSELIPFVAPISAGGGKRKRLVESLGLLYLVVSCKKEFVKSNKRPKFKVYELNEVRNNWREITSLGDRFFLFGVNFSFSASAHELRTDMKNCILFGRCSFNNYSGYDNDYEEFPKPEISEIDIRVWYMDDTDHSIELYLDYLDSLWPPPGWIWNIDRLKRIGIVETTINRRPFDTINGIAENIITVGGTVVRDLKKRANIYHVEETEFIHGLRESSMEILNKVEQPGTSSSHGTTVERHGWPDNFKTSATYQDPPLRSTMSMLRKRDACLYSIEEQATLLKTNFLDSWDY